MFNEPLRVVVERALVQIVEQIVVLVAVLVDAGRAKQQHAANIPQDALRPVGAPDVANTKRGRDRDQQRPQRAVMMQRVLRVVRTAERRSAQRNYRHVQRATRQCHGRCVGVKREVQFHALSFARQAENGVDVRIAVGQVLLDRRVRVGARAHKVR